MVTQAGLGLRCPHMHEDTFLHCAALVTRSFVSGQQVQSTLVISKSEGLTEILRDARLVSVPRYIRFAEN